MRLFIEQLLFALLTLALALAIIYPAFRVVDFLIHRGHIVAVAGVLSLAALLMVFYSRRYGGSL